MKRWTIRRALVGAVAITLTLGARHADAQVVQSIMAGAPRIAPPVMDEPMQVVARRPPPDWRLVQAPQMAWRNYLAGQRRVQIARLTAYAQAGIFPENRVRPGRLNVFIDGNGRLCAFANLLSLAGHRSTVDRVSRANNFVRFADVSGGPLMDWTLSSGLTREEIIRVQEPYEYIPQGVPANVEWQAEQAERARLQAHFSQVIRELEANFEGSLNVAVVRLGSHVREAPHDLALDAPIEPEPVVQPIVYPQPVVQPVVYPQPVVRPYYVQPVVYSQPVVVYPEPVLRPVRVNAYSQPMVYPTPQPVVMPYVQPAPYVQPQPVQVHVNVNVQVQPTPTLIIEE